MEQQEFYRIRDDLQERANNIAEAIKSKDLKVSTSAEDFAKLSKEVAWVKSYVRDLNEKINNTNFGDVWIVKDALNKLITSAGIDNEHRGKLLKYINSINTEQDFMDNASHLEIMLDNAIEEQKQQQIQKNINWELEYTKNLKKGSRSVGKYDIDTVRLFNDIRYYNAMNQNTAFDTRNELLLSTPRTEQDNPEFKFKMLFLDYKRKPANSTSSNTLLNILNQIRTFKNEGKQIKQQLESEKRENFSDVKNELIKNIKESRFHRDNLKTKALKFTFLSNGANQNDLDNFIGGKSFAEKMNLESYQSNTSVEVFKKMNRLYEKAFTILDVKNKNEFYNKIQDWGLDKFEISYYAPNRTETANTKWKLEKLSTMHLIDIYNAIKNEKTAEEYYYKYSDPNIEDPLFRLEDGKIKIQDILNNNLTDEQKQFADLMMEEVANRNDSETYYDRVNEIMNRVYYTDLGKRTNYWMRTVEYQKQNDLFDMYGTNMMYADNGAINPSFTKETVKNLVPPKPSNAFNKFVNYIENAEFLINEAEHYKFNVDLYSDLDIRNLITDKYGKDIMDNKDAQMKNMSLYTQSVYRTINDNIFMKAHNNWVVAKIASPRVFFKQLTSITNYMVESKSSTSWLKHLSHALTHPVETFEYMNKMDFIIERRENGFNRELQVALNKNDSGAIETYFEKIHLNKIADNITKMNLTKWTTMLTRWGDSFAIIFGGYAQIQANIENGMTRTDAMAKFQESTIRTQQSGIKASLSNKQMSNNIIEKMLLTFKNAGISYKRAIANSIIQYSRGEITKQQLSKVLFNYLVLQVTAVAMVDKAAQSIGRLGDDDEKRRRRQKREAKEKEKSKESIISIPNPIQTYTTGVFDMLTSDMPLANAAVRMLTNSDSKLINIGILSDIEKDYKKFKQSDGMTLETLAGIMETVGEATTGLPIKKVAVYGKTAKGIKERIDH